MYIILCFWLYWIYYLLIVFVIEGGDLDVMFVVDGKLLINFIFLVRVGFCYVIILVIRIFCFFIVFKFLFGMKNEN